MTSTMTTAAAREAPCLSDLAIDRRDVALLDQIREAAMTCRLARRSDTELLCALRHHDRSASAEAYLSALLRLLPVSLRGKVVFYRPGTVQRTFDENWLLRLLAVIGQDDRDSTTFALASRLPRHFHAPIRYLAHAFIVAQSETG